jgi:hypothetical protein
MDQPATTTGLQLRRRVLAALEDVYSPLAGHDELRPLLEGLHRQPVSPAALDDLMAEELRAFDAGVERPVWLCRGIRPDLHGVPGSWARSDWAPWVRVVHPDSRLVREYWLLRQLWWVLPSDADVHPSPLTELFIRKAKLLPAKEVERVRRRCRHDPDYDWARDRFWIWGNVVAEDLFDRYAEEDGRRCEQVADALVQLDRRAQLFGLPSPQQ